MVTSAKAVTSHQRPSSWRTWTYLTGRMGRASRSARPAGPRLEPHRLPTRNGFQRGGGGTGRLGAAHPLSPRWRRRRVVGASVTTPVPARFLKGGRDPRRHWGAGHSGGAGSASGSRSGTTFASPVEPGRWRRMTLPRRRRPPDPHPPGRSGGVGPHLPRRYPVPDLPRTSDSCGRTPARSAYRAQASQAGSSVCARMRSVRVRPQRVPPSSPPDSAKARWIIGDPGNCSAQPSR